MKPLHSRSLVARMPADHACRKTTGADEMKLNEIIEGRVEKWWNEICGRRKREKPREKPTQSPFRPSRNPHEVTQTRTRDTIGGRGASNRLRHEAAILVVVLILIIIIITIKISIILIITYSESI